MPKWTDYTTKTTVADNDEIMTLDTAGKANKRLSLSTLSDWVLGKIADKVFEKLQTNDKTILGAINELNSNAQKIGFKGNIKSVEFRSGGTGLKNIYIDFYQADNSRSTLAFLTDGENAIGFYYGSTNIWKLTVK